MLDLQSLSGAQDDAQRQPRSPCPVLLATAELPRAAGQACGAVDSLPWTHRVE